jgi:hypothetical protein
VLFVRAGVRQLHSSQGRNFLKLFRARKVSALALMFNSDKPGIFGFISLMEVNLAGTIWQEYCSPFSAF